MTEEQKATQRAYMAKRSRERKAAGQCVACGEPNDRLPKVLCTACAKKVRDTRENKTAQARAPEPLRAPADVRPLRETAAKRIRWIDIAYTDQGYLLTGQDLDGERFAFLAMAGHVHALVQGLTAAVEASRPPATVHRLTRQQAT